MELKVFTLPTCPSCEAAKKIALEVSEKFNIAFKEVDLTTKDGLQEGLALQIMSVPSIVFNNEVIVRGRLISREKLEEEVRFRIEKMKGNSSSGKV